MCRTTFLIIASEAALGLRIAIEKLDDLLQLAGNDLRAMGNQLVRLWH